VAQAVVHLLLLKLEEAELIHQYKVLQEEVLPIMTLEEAEAVEVQDKLELMEMVGLELVAVVYLQTLLELLLHVQAVVVEEDVITIHSQFLEQAAQVVEVQELLQMDHQE
jgi:hypothetical protein